MTGQDNFNQCLCISSYYRSANLQRELHEAVERYTADKQLLKEKEEAIVALQSFYGGLMEKVITSDRQSQTDDLQVYNSY